MRTRNHGKYTNMSMTNPRAIGRCDYSGFMVEHSKLAKQMEYRGRSLVWTGFWVYSEFLDLPNPQNLTPLIKLDPKPIKDARPDNIIDAQNTIATSVGILTVPVSVGDYTIDPQDFASHGSFNFTGNLTADVVVYIPNFLKTFYANNFTTGGFTLGMQLSGNVTPPLTIPPADPITLLGPLVSNTTLNLQIIKTDYSDQL